MTPRRVVTRMGDGSTVEMTRDEIRKDVVEGSEAAAAKAKIPVLDENECDYLVDMFCCPSRIWGVQRGHEAILTKDGGTNTLISSRLSCGVAAPIGRETAVRLFESAFAFDSMEVGHVDYSVKPSKFIVSLEQEHMELLQHTTILPLFYGFMPNLGLYYQPDGQFPNPSDLLPRGKIDEARKTQEEALEACHNDVVWQSRQMQGTGADAINFDTVASTGDAEFLATLRAVEAVTAETGIPVELSMASEMVLGFHGELEYKGTRLAGLWPHQQMRLAEEAGACIFGPVVNNNSRKSCAWNISRAVTFVKACTADAKIPIHANVGGGVGGVPMCEVSPLDIVSRASAAMIEVGKADGL
jgi:dimethylamine---corrinoid protein Co-methyltransferase